MRSREADFWRLWYVGLVAAIVRWLEMVVVGVVVYERTGSPFVVAVITMLRMVPMGLVGAVLGAVVERVDRRLALAALLGLMALTSGVLAVVAALGALEVWHLAVLSLVNGCGWATDNPMRRAMMGEAVRARAHGLGDVARRRRQQRQPRRRPGDRRPL